MTWCHDACNALGEVTISLLLNKLINERGFDEALASLAPKTEPFSRHLKHFETVVLLSMLVFHFSKCLFHSPGTDPQKSNPVFAGALLLVFRFDEHWSGSMCSDRLRLVQTGSELGHDLQVVETQYEKQSKITGTQFDTICEICFFRFHVFPFPVRSFHTLTRES